jgi:vacuolar-type H+-ATPase subunit F/Vma7
MKGTVGVICSPALASGFRLAGLAPHCAALGDDAVAALGRLLAAPAGVRPGVVLLEEGLAAALPPSLRRRLERDPALLVVPFPAARADAAAAPDAFLLEILRQAIGYRVRLG